MKSNIRLLDICRTVLHVGRVRQPVENTKPLVSESEMTSRVWLSDRRVLDVLHVLHPSNGQTFDPGDELADFFGSHHDDFEEH